MAGAELQDLTVGFMPRGRCRAAGSDHSICATWRMQIPYNLYETILVVNVGYTRVYCCNGKFLCYNLPVLFAYAEASDINAIAEMAAD